MATCPFHTMVDYVSVTLSFNLVRGVFFCFSCKTKGNLRTFLRDLGQDTQWVEANYGVLNERLEKLAPDVPEPLQPTTQEALPEALLGLFDQPPLPLIEEGFSEELLKALEVGIDSDHQRITFPIRDHQGRLMGISGRTLNPHAAQRYKVYSTEYAAWGLRPRNTDKSHYLWNLHRFYKPRLKSMPDDVPIVVTEGYKACLKVVENGHSTTCALQGSYLSPQQLWLLETLGCPVYLMLDNNAAGRNGTFYAGDKLSRSLPTFVVPYGTEQPDRLRPTEQATALNSVIPYQLWATERN